MIEKRVERIEDEISNIREDVVDSKQALLSISKDIHSMSQTSIDMKNALTKLLETEVKFQLHAQESRQAQLDHGKLISALFKRVELIELTTKVVDEDHKIVQKLSDVFWKALGWVATAFAFVIGTVILFVAKAGGFNG